MVIIMGALSVYSKRFVCVMNKENLAAVANTSAVAGAGTGFWSLLADNSSQITILVLVATFIVSAIAHYYDKRVKLDRVKIEAEKAKIERERLDMDLRKMELEIRLKHGDIEVKTKEHSVKELE